MGSGHAPETGTAVSSVDNNMAILALKEHSPRKDTGTGSTPDVELRKGIIQE
jgi:hypothetical protein